MLQKISYGNFFINMIWSFKVREIRQNEKQVFEIKLEIKEEAL